MDASSLEKLCMSFKGTTQDIKWKNDLCYLVGEKMYCVTSLQGFQYVSFKASPEDFSALIEREGILPAPYSARYHWVMVDNVRALNPSEWRNFIQKSYEMVLEKLPKKKKDSI